MNHYCDLISMATVWSAPKQKYEDAIVNMDPRWEEDKVRDEERDESLS